MTDKLSRWLSVLSLIIAGAALTYTIILNERGPVAPRPDLQFSVADKIRMVTQPSGLLVSPDIEIFNSGKGTAKIGKMLIYVSLDSPNSTSRSLLVARYYRPMSGDAELPLGSFLLRPSDLWNARVFFPEHVTEDVMDSSGDLDFRIGSYLQKQVLDHPEKTSHPLLPDKLYAELKEQMARRTEWLKKGEYRLLLTIRGGTDNKETVFQRGYRFRLTAEQLKGLKEYQLESYKSPPKFQNSRFMVFTVTSTLKELLPEELELLIKEYDNLPKGSAL